MDTQLLVNFLTDPLLLFFGLGVLAKVLTIDLQIPAPVSEFILMYLLFSISYMGGQVLVPGDFPVELIYAIVLSSLLAGLLIDFIHAAGLKQFALDLFKGFLAIFLLATGMVTVLRMSSFTSHWLYLPALGILIPACCRCLVAVATRLGRAALASRCMFAILASPIAVPAAMRIAAPKAGSGHCVPVDLGFIFSFNISLAMVLYLSVIQLS
jgi:hypothetical protein